MDLSRYTTVAACDGAIAFAEGIGYDTSELKTHRAKLAEEEKKKKEKEESEIVDSETPIWDTLKKHYGYNDGVMPEEKIKCVEDTVAKLLEDGSDAKRPGLLLGKIQSGKTDTFENIIGLSFDKGIDIAIVLQKGTNVLLDQTKTRFIDDFIWFKPTNKLSQKAKVTVLDVRNLEEGIDIADEEGHKIIITCMKEKANLDQLLTLFNITQTELKGKKVLIVDDEADFASRNYNNVKLDTKYDDEGSIVIQKQEIELAHIAQQIDNFVKNLPYCRYLQVTATPYCLYLQPDHSLFLSNGIVESFKPRFTSIVPIHSGYVGGEQFFTLAEDPNSMFSCLYHKMEKKCIDVLGKEDRRQTKSGVGSDNLYDLTYALVSYFMATAIRVIQERNINDKLYKSSAIIHVETTKKFHAWQKEIVMKFIDGIKKHIVDGEIQSANVTKAIENAYASFVESNAKGIEEGILGQEWIMPSKEDVLSEMKNILNGQFVVKLINSDIKKIGSVLNEKGQLALKKTANIFIGGSILDRGITISNLICTIYGREPNQQDTVLQHARFYGSRKMKDMAVTRLHTTYKLYRIMKRMNELDERLRQSVANNDGTEVVCIGYDKEFRPCAASKIKASDAITVKGGKRTLPIGFQTKTRTEIGKLVKSIEEKIKSLPHYKEQDEDGFFEMTKDEAFDLLKLIKSTYVYDKKYENVFYKNDMDELMSTLEVCTRQSGGLLYGCLRSNRDINRIRLSNGNFESAPDGRDSKLTKAKATDCPVLLFLLEKGDKNIVNGVNIGWNGTEFFWPVLTAQADLSPMIYANKQKSDGNTAVFDLDEFLDDIDRADVLRMSVNGDLLQNVGKVGAKSKVKEFIAELKSDTVAMKYIYKNGDGSWELNPEANVDMEKFAGIYTYNGGVFPFVMKPFTHVLITNGRLAMSDVMLVEINSEDTWATVPVQDFNKKGYLLSADKKTKLIKASDVIIDKFGNESDFFNDNLCLWLISYPLGKVVKFQERANIVWDETNED